MGACWELSCRVHRNWGMLANLCRKLTWSLYMCLLWKLHRKLCLPLCWKLRLWLSMGLADHRLMWGVGMGMIHRGGVWDPVRMGCWLVCS